MSTFRAFILVGLMTTTVFLINGCGNQEIRAQCKDLKYPCIQLKTSKGGIVIRLNSVKAPVTTNNFLRYIDEDFYDDTIFHRVVANFVIQGGGFDSTMREKENNPAIVNEALNGLSNKKGTIAMARTNDPNSATSQFYINMRDNLNLDGRIGVPGYAVFGEVIEGLDVAEEIGQVQTTNRQGHQGVPKDLVVLHKAVRW